MKTKFFTTTAMGNFTETQVPKWLWLEAETVVHCSLGQLTAGNVIVIPGRMCRVLGRLMRMPLAQPIVRRLAKNRRASKNDRLR